MCLLFAEEEMLTWQYWMSWSYHAEQGDIWYDFTYWGGSVHLDICLVLWLSCPQLTTGRIVMWLSHLSACHNFPEEKEFGTTIFLVVPFFTQPSFWSVQSKESVHCEYRGTELLSKQLHDGFASFQELFGRGPDRTNWERKVSKIIFCRIIFYYFYCLLDKTQN